jgi:hypothetical protein
MKLFLGLFVVGGGLLSVWWWRLRPPPDRGKFVSSTWLDDHIRGRRE